MNQFTEKDLQEYFDGRFEGNAEALREYFISDDDRKALLDTYRLMFDVLKKEKAVFRVPGMEQKLIASLQKQKSQKKKAQEAWMMRGMGLLVLVACIYCVSLLHIKGFNSSEALYVMIVAVILFGFLFFSYSGDMKRLKRKYSL